LVHEIYTENGGTDLESFINSDDIAGNLDLFTPMKRSLTLMYFALTTLTTIGLGDYYPINDAERLVGSFVLLFGVMTSNFIMGELMNMIIKMQYMDYDFVIEEEELERFFEVLSNFNKGFPIDKEMYTQFRQFFHFKW